MPISTFQRGHQGSWDAFELTPFSAGVPVPVGEGGFFGDRRFEFLIWYPRIILRSIPDLVSRDLKYYGNKHYLGEVAFINFGHIDSVHYLNYERQQFPYHLAFPVPVFESPNTPSSDVPLSINFSLPSFNRARSMQWDLKQGVSITIEVVWLKVSFGYNDNFGFLRVI